MSWRATPLPKPGSLAREELEKRALAELHRGDWSDADTVARTLKMHHGDPYDGQQIGRLLSRLGREGKCEVLFTGYMARYQAKDRRARSAPAPTSFES